MRDAAERLGFSREKVAEKRPNRSMNGEERYRAEISDFPFPFIIPGRCQ